MAKKSTSAWLELCDDIDDGVYDEGLQEIARTIQTRLDVRDAKRARRMISLLEKGSRVMIVNKPSPRYLEGMIGTVRKLDIENQAAVVMLDELPTPGRGRPSGDGPSQRIVIPFLHLMIVSDDIVAPKQPKPEEVGDDEEYDDEEDDEDDEEDDEEDDDD